MAKAEYNISITSEEAGNNIAAIIDHTILKAVTTKSDVSEVCREAREFQTASVCVNPFYVKHAVKELAGSGIPVASVIGFPLGANTTQCKKRETEIALNDGAEEFDMVINIGALKAGDYETVKEDIQAVVQASQGKIVKVIIETALLTNAEKVKACELSLEAGAQFVKTSTGFSSAGATAEDIALMRKTVGNKAGVKASGGIRTFDDAMVMVKAGANRIGASATRQIVNKK
jgi:deoxyribose-phosphate aldolase